jgi:hypothetical protein
MLEIERLLSEYKDYNISKNRSLAGNYFHSVLREYKGAVHTPIILRIFAYNTLITNDGEQQQKFIINEEPLSINLDLDSNKIILIRVIVEIRFENSKEVLGHSNLIIIDSSTKNIYHFEPLNILEFSQKINIPTPEFKYYILVNTTLRLIMERNLPEYKFSTYPLHPQGLPSSEKKDRFMCVAYVIYLSCLLATGRKISFNTDEEDICKFAEAIESLYELESPVRKTVPKCIVKNGCPGTGLIIIFTGRQYMLFRVKK